MRGGAEDFLEKRAPKDKVLDAVKRSLARDTRERESRTRQRDLRARFDALSKRELEVLAHVVQGRLNKQIAGELATTERTIKFHRANIMRKMQAESVADLVKMAQKLGLGE